MMPFGKSPPKNRCHATQAVAPGADPHRMARRADPERIFQARRDAVRYTLMDTGMDEATADRSCDAWEIEAACRQLPRDSAYWRRAPTRSMPSAPRGDPAGPNVARA